MPLRERERERKRERKRETTHTHAFRYVQEFPLGLTHAQYVDMLEALKRHGWTDEQTRAVIMDTTLYNAELNTFLNLRVAFEFRPHGFVASYVSKRAMRIGCVE